MKTPPKVTDWRQLFPTPWPAIWAWIFLAIIVLGIATPTSILLAIIKLGGILLCAFYTLRVFPKDRILHIAMIVTFAADIILALNNIDVTGVMVFLIAQLLHLARLDGERMKVPITIYSISAFLCIFGDILLPIVEPIYVACSFYVLTIFTIIYVSWRWWKQRPENPRARFACFGFLLFLCCEACSGLSYLSLIHAIPQFFYAPANFFAWFFYYPSQVLISNSSNYQTRKKSNQPAQSDHFNPEVISTG